MARLARRDAAVRGHARARASTALHRAQALRHGREAPPGRRQDQRKPSRPVRRRARRRRCSSRSRVRRPRAAIVVTGSELVRGERSDLNGPFYAREALSLGLQPIRVSIVGDDADELEAALREGSTADVCLVSGGLGPTHDDRTVELVARVAGVGLAVDVSLAARIEEISRSIAERLQRPYADFAAGVTKQATLPVGGVYVGPAGTAPGVVLPVAGCVYVVLPGPPSELRRLWPEVLATAPLQALLARTAPPERRVLRLFGVSESAVAKALADAGGDGGGVEVTICAREFEIHVDAVVEPGAEARADALLAAMREPVEEHVFAEDERSVGEIVLGLCRARGWTLGTAESCTGGLVAARLTDVPGSSDVYLGSIVAYANEIKRRELGVPEEVLERHGAVSAETAAALAHGARDRLGVDVAIGVTGIAGPGGAMPGKPVGLVHLHAVTPA
ncbi:MAG: nicotinamide-nucleotide amidohydrolase family protein, partial [Actinobacteria bacterium]|nr:nicotinamide-nucleotide amidohydrolase family protein [Actinomycetota bacterium]